MLFNSLEFVVFFVVVFFTYWFVVGSNLRIQNLFLLLASYFFYGWWDVRFLFLLFFSTFLDYFTGLQMHRAQSEGGRKLWFWLSIVVNLGFLAFFKYYNFFIDSFVELASSLGGGHFDPWTLKIILPVGISFYTFHGMSYVIDIYKRRIEPTRNFEDYALFVSFFPLLVAGPIERATHLLPQVRQKRVFHYGQAVEGMRLILWGLFKKVVIADNCATVVNEVFSRYETSSSGELVIGILFFAFQIYGDFSGYTDIARGTARLMGFDLMLNFKMPYFSRDVAEFWRRWHISLSSWFRDYLYIPLGGSKRGRGIALRNTFIIFIVSGFWHGANWTFIVWGALHALYFIPLLLSARNRTHLDTVADGRLFPAWKEAGQMLLTFSLVCFAWIFFRAESVSAAFGYIQGILRFDGLRPAVFLGEIKIIALIGILVVFEWCWRSTTIPFPIRNLFIRRVAYVLVVLLILFFGAFVNPSDFIYFQF